MSDEIKALARRAALANLRMRDALALFDALYAADALLLERGNISAAAARAGILRENFHRHYRGRGGSKYDPPCP